MGEATAALAQTCSIGSLPVTPFELYYLLDDRPGYPTVFPIRIWLRGQLNRAAFEDAVRRTVARHPLLTSRIDVRSGWPRWTQCDAPTVCWRQEDDEAPFDGAIDLYRQCGLKIAVHAGGDKTVVLLIFHHACADGLAAAGFAGELLQAYEHIRCAADGEPPWQRLDPERLARRAEYGLADYKPKFMDLVNTVRAWLPLLLRRAAVVYSPNEVPADEQDKETLGFAVHCFSRQESRRLNELCRSLGVTLNDLLLRDLFVTLAEWNRSTPEAGRPIRILVPTNLRAEEDCRMPAANVLSFAFLVRRATEIADQHRLLTGIRDETKLIKRWRLGLYFVGGLAIASRWPSLLRWFLNRRWPFATAVFSNLGNIFSQTPLPRDQGKLVSGGLMMDQVGGVPPLRRDTRLGIVVATYAGQLCVFLRCDPRWFSGDMQRQLLAAYARRIAKTIA